MTRRSGLPAAQARAARRAAPLRPRAGPLLESQAAQRVDVRHRRSAAARLAQLARPALAGRLHAGGHDTGISPPRCQIQDSHGQASCMRTEEVVNSDQTAHSANTALDDSERQPCEVWTRVMGYHRPITSFNRGKLAEYRERCCFAESYATAADTAPSKDRARD